MNKYGGVNDLPNCDKKIYNLWYRMLRRCYDEKQLERPRGKTYNGCEVCKRWKILSNFAEDLKELEGYSEWVKSENYCLDKDTLNPNNKVYNKENCRFITKSDNIADIHKRKPQNIEKLHEQRKTKYILTKEDKTLIFDSEKEACEYLGVAKCTVASCYRRKTKCKGYTIAKMNGKKVE